MKTILGLDLGSTSIGWAVVREAETENEESDIIKCGVRIVPLSTDEKTNFLGGKAATTNQARQIARGARRRLFRYKMRREKLIRLLVDSGLLDSIEDLRAIQTLPSMQLISLRAKAVKEQITLSELAFLLLLINKKRGYKSNRKEIVTDDGNAINGYELAQTLYDQGITPGEFLAQEPSDSMLNKYEFFPSDIANELERIIQKQREYYKELLADVSFLGKKGEREVSKYFYNKFNLTGADVPRGESKIHWIARLRAKGLREFLTEGELVLVLGKLSGLIYNSSSLLGQISDRSKELMVGDLSIGQYLEKVNLDVHRACSSGIVFYRQDYQNEFDKIWSCQSKYYEKLTDKLKQKIGRETIFMQRSLRSKKGEIARCSFEGDRRVTPKSSPIYQQFKLLSSLNNLLLYDYHTKQNRKLEETERKVLIGRLQVVDKLQAKEVLKLLKLSSEQFSINLLQVEGNCTLKVIYETILAYVQEVNESKRQKEQLSLLLKVLGVNDIHSLLEESELIKESKLMQFWHLLYSYQGDGSRSGIDSLILIIKERYQFDDDLARRLASMRFQDDYGSLSERAIKKITPFLRKGYVYSDACGFVGYNHSFSRSKEQIEERTLADCIEIINKGELRNPIVEKVLNQMIHIVNQLLRDKEVGQIDEVRIELARELKQSQEERESTARMIKRSEADHQEIKKILQNEFNLTNVSRNDIIRYKLYRELENNGYKTLYSDTYISPNQLFNGNFEIEHIIPQSRLFDDSFSNKTLETHSINQEKGNQTAWDYIKSKWGEQGIHDFEQRLVKMVKQGEISKTKYKKLLIKGEEIPDDFIERDLRNSQYIAKKSVELLDGVVRNVSTTTGSVTARLRKDWGLMDVMKELNYQKFKALGKTRIVTKRNNQEHVVIDGWTKRNDHRHHAVDAIVVAFTKPAYINYLNHLNSHKSTVGVVRGLERKYIENGSFIAPFLSTTKFRQCVKNHLEQVLVSIKNKNKVVTIAKNRTKQSGSKQLTQVTLTPRGKLHEETIYRQMKDYEVTIEQLNTKMNVEKAQTITSLPLRTLVLQRLSMFDNDAKKAFGGKNTITKVPLLDAKGNEISEVKCKKTFYSYTKRIDITGLKDINSVVDEGIKRILLNRQKSMNCSFEKMIESIKEEPILFNTEQCIPIKKIQVYAGVQPMPLRISEQNGKEKMIDYVKPGNNHHALLFEDASSNWHERIVTFYEAVQRAVAKEQIIDRSSRDGLTFKLSLMTNEFVLIAPEGIDLREFDLMAPANKDLISKYLYRVQKISSKDYTFRHHLEAQLIDDKEMNGTLFHRIQSLNNLKNVIKVRLDHLGNVVAVGN